MTRPGFAFSTVIKVRYAEIDGQKVVFNSRYLEYTDVAATEFWEWTGIEEALGATWSDMEFHIRRAEIDYLKPFIWGDTVQAYVRIARIGASSLTQRYELCHAQTGTLHASVDMVIVNVDLSSGRTVAIPDPVRSFIQALPTG
jgi:YbgC/YbaW family acyl-CoA thioester hydrolase